MSVAAALAPCSTPHLSLLPPPCPRHTAQPGALLAAAVTPLELPDPWLAPLRASNAGKPDGGSPATAARRVREASAKASAWRRLVARGGAAAAAVHACTAAALARVQGVIAASVQAAMGAAAVAQLVMLCTDGAAARERRPPRASPGTHRGSARSSRLRGAP